MLSSFEQELRATHDGVGRRVHLVERTLRRTAFRGHRFVGGDPRLGAGLERAAGDQLARQRGQSTLRTAEAAILIFEPLGVAFDDFADDRRCFARRVNDVAL